MYPRSMNMSGFDLKPCEHQVAGHLFEEGKAGCLVDNRGHFYKPIQPGPRGDREKEFYERLHLSKEEGLKEYRNGSWNRGYIEAFTSILHGGSYSEAIKSLLVVTQEQTISDRRFSSLMSHRCPTFSRQESILYKGEPKKINVLQKDESGMVEWTKIGDEEIIWGDNENDDATEVSQECGEPPVDFADRIDLDSIPEKIKSLPFLIRHAPLLKAIPKFYKVCSVENRTLLELEDLARMYSHPCIIDIKIGHRTWYPDADESYIERCKKKDANTTQLDLGFKICGMQVYRHSVGGYWRASKRWCKTLSKSTIDRALESFVHNENGLKPMDVYGGPGGVIHQMSLLEEWFAYQTEFCFYSSSILILYEGDAKSSSEANISLRMVDFAHAFSTKNEEQMGRDENYLEGLKSFKAHLVRLLSKYF